MVISRVQGAVRDEAYRSMDPLRRLPELLAAALPVMPEVVVGPDRALVSNARAGWRGQASWVFRVCQLGRGPAGYRPC